MRTIPKQTFLNLAADKRQRFLEACVDEFALFDYRTASISKIVLSAGISKGSVYQYFENKKDLYYYLIDYISGIKLEYLNRQIDFSAGDFFTLYKQLIFTSSKFDLAYPRYSRVLYNAGRESRSEEIGDVPKKLLDNSIAYLKTLIVNAQQKDQLRTDLPPDLMAFVIGYLSVDIGEYITKKYNFSYYDLLKSGGQQLPVPENELGTVMDDLVKLLMNGLKPASNVR